MAVIRIEDLVVRTIVGINDWERAKTQDILINIEMEFDATRAIETDNIEDTLNYKNIKQKIVDFASDSKFFLLEKLVGEILAIILEDAKVLAASVRIDKPHALRFSKTVSIEMHSVREKG